MGIFPIPILASRALTVTETLTVLAPVLAGLALVLILILGQRQMTNPKTRIWFSSIMILVFTLKLVWDLSRVLD